ncbi:peroxisome biogenesis protein 22-like isoform X2 [Andrographis paniculata]|uniref:peroxisome biogenesis protein 22-like isoform X2 n=1 Tax=Andrographis paniculata TaxID=175694 RepID=UPI0021E7BAB4|nr:peroxisome biogenesis protein 22-like isoform X2 [Andrographis paniculata]
MGDNSKEDFLHLIKRVWEFLTVEFFNLLDRLDSRSIGAIAGLAFAVVFTWRVLRTPSGSQRRQPKRQAPTASSSSVGSEEISDRLLSGISNPSEDLKTQNVIDEFFQPVKPTLSQIVRQRLSEGRKVTCQLLDIILEESSPEQLQKNVLSALEEAGVFTSSGLVKDKVLFCSTENGRTSFVRQLEPDWHIDSNPDIITQLARFIKFQLHVSPVKLDRPPPNVFTATSLEQFFGCT